MNGAGKLHRFVASDQLTPDLNGHLAYDHDNWIEIRMVSFHLLYLIYI